MKPLYETVLQTLPDVVKSFLGSQVLLSLPFIPEIRRAYVPEMVLSLHRVHVEAGRWIYKGLLRSALDLAADVADPDRTILDTFIETGRLEEYVDEIAAVSRVILGAVQEGTKDGKDQLGIWSVAK